MSKTFEMNRRRRLAGALMLPLSATWAAANPHVVEVWKAPRFGFCQDWVSIPEQTGFAVRVIDTGNSNSNSAARSQLDIPIRLGSCHTACVAGYSTEGHVPVREIQCMLRAKPKAAGLAVSGMPVGSPGMGGPIRRGRKDPNSVLLAQHNGSSSVYQSYP